MPKSTNGPRKPAKKTTKAPIITKGAIIETTKAIDTTEVVGAKSDQRLAELEAAHLRNITRATREHRRRFTMFIIDDETLMDTLANLDPTNRHRVLVTALENNYGYCGTPRLDLRPGRQRLEVPINAMLEPSERRTAIAHVIFGFRRAVQLSAEQLQAAVVFGIAP